MNEELQNQEFDPTEEPVASPAPAEETAPPIGAETDEPEDPLSEEIDYARIAMEDLAEIKRLDPSYAPAVHLGDLPFAHRFAELRDLGLSVAEALAAAAPRFDRYDGRRHLRAVAPRGTKSPDGGLDRDRMKEAKMLFSGMSEAEINALYRRVSQKNN